MIGYSVDKQHILKLLYTRIEELKAVYKNTVDQVSKSGTELSYGSSRVIRCNTKRDLQLCCLIYQLALFMDDKAEIVDDDAIAGLMRLLKPSPKVKCKAKEMV